MVYFSLQGDGVRDVVLLKASEEDRQLSQESGCVQEWLFLSSSQLDDFENSSPAREEEELDLAPGEPSNLHPEPGDSLNLHDKVSMEAGTVQGMRSRKRMHPES